MRLRRYVVALAFSVALGSGSRAEAQATGFAANRFEPSERGSEWFASESLDLRGHLRPAAGIVMDYANRPLAIYAPDGSLRTAVLRDQLFAHLGGSLVLWDRLRLALDLPVAVYQDGDTGTLRGITYPGPASSTAIGDLRLGADVRLAGEHGDAFTAAVGAQLFVPTGSRADYTSDGSTRVLPRLLVAGDVGPFAYAARIGVELRGSNDLAGANLGSQLSFGAAGGVRLAERKLLVGPELSGATGINGSDAIFAKQTTPIEALLGAHYSFAKDWRAGAGAGPGLSRGDGTPIFRVVASVEWVPPIAAPPPAPPPPPERVVEPPPPAPEVPPPPPPPAPPPDRDGDGIPDDKDACPDEPGFPNEDPTKNGCPKAFVAQGQIKISDHVKFATNKADILPGRDSQDVLLAVLSVLQAHPEIKKLSVEGHTDSSGEFELNRTLGDQRAAAVLRWLTAHGIESARLSSIGYGPSRPIDDNGTPAGRQNNRRVEFVIVEDSK